MVRARQVLTCSTMHVRGCIGFCFFMAMSGCMGGGSSGSETSALEMKRAAADQMFADFTPVEYTNLSIVPTTGQVMYSGFVSGALSNMEDDVTDTLIGDLSINVSFEGPEIISGVANGFLDDDGNILTGEINLSAGELDRNGDPDVDATLTFEGSGQLQASNGDVLVIDADFAGDFLGQQYEAVGGEALGQVTVDGVNQSFGGGFIATR